MRLSRRSFLSVLPAPLVPGFLRSEGWVPDNPFAFDPPPNVNPNDFPTPPVWSPNERPDARWQFTKTEYDRIMAALEQHGILNTNSTIDSPHPDQAVHTLKFGGGRGFLDENGMRLTYPNAIYWGASLADPVPTYPYAKIASDAGTTYPGTTIVLEDEAHVDADNHTSVRQSVDPALSGSYVTLTAENAGTTASLVMGRGGVFGSAALFTNVNLSVASGFILMGGGVEKTIATGVITATESWHTVDTEGDAGTDDLATINGGVTGAILVLTAANSTRDVVVKDSTGNLKLNGDMTLTHANDSITLLCTTGSEWVEIARSDNTA